MCMDELGSQALISPLLGGWWSQSTVGWIAVRGKREMEGEEAKSKGGVGMDMVVTDWIKDGSCYSVHLSQCVT